MIQMAGVWELGWNTPIKEIDLWEFIVRDFGVDKLYMAPISGIQNDFVHELHSLDSVLYDCRSAGTSVVFVDEKGKTELQNFVHPENVLYVFGKVSFSAFGAYAKPEDQSIFIKTQHDMGVLWPHQCAALVLYDRMLKCQ